MNRCEGCGDEALRAPVRVGERVLALCCTCRKYLDRHDRTPDVPITQVAELPVPRHDALEEMGPRQLDTLAYFHQRGVR